MDDNELKFIIEDLDKEWEIPNGFFYKSRAGIMDEQGYLRVIAALEKGEKLIATCPEEKHIDRDFVKAIWFLPLFLTWQEDRIKANGFPVEIYMGQWIARIEQIVESILGSP